MPESVIGSGDIHSGDYFTPADLVCGDTVTLYNRIFFVSAPVPRIDTLCMLAVRPLPCLSGVLDPCTATHVQLLKPLLMKIFFFVVAGETLCCV